MPQTPFSRQLFVNLPVADLNRTVDFFATLGFAFNPQFTDDNAACMVVSDRIQVMLLARPFFAGFWLWQVRSLEEAIEWARRCPDPHPGSGGSSLEIRPLYEADDFGDAFTPELREQEDRLRQRIGDH